MITIKNSIGALLMVMCISVNAQFVQVVKAGIDQRIQDLQLTKNEMVEADTIFRQIHNNVIIKELEEEVAGILNIIISNKLSINVDALIMMLKTDRHVRERLITVTYIFLDAYKKCLSQENISLQSCDRIFMAVGMIASQYYLSRFEKEITILMNNK